MRLVNTAARGVVPLAALGLVSLAALRPSAARGQFLDTPAAEAGPRLGEPRVQRFRIGVVVKAEGGPVRGIYATMPIPADWPEQKVRVVSEDVSPGVRNLRYRPLGAGVKQVVVEIPDVAAGETVKAVVTFEIERASIQAPADTSRLKEPEKPDRAIRAFLGPGPYIESRHSKIVKLAKEAAGDHEGWSKVEAIYDAVREKVEYREGPLKGAARALADGWGDCEELTCLFIAACRSQGIPARTVWVEGHCYPEFYLVDATGKGWWFPCQAAGTRAFGSMPDCLPILQKGDAFRDPDRPAETLRYVSEFVRGTTDGDGQPKVQFIREGA